MNRNSFAITAGIGCAVLVVLLLVAIPAAFLLPAGRFDGFERQLGVGRNESVPTVMPQAAIPTLTLEPGLPLTGAVTPTAGASPAVNGVSPLGGVGAPLVELYQQQNPGVVNIRVFVQSGPETGEGAGSGFILDEQGHIVTNDHVVENAEEVIVVFFDGFEARAEVIGSDNDSDLAVIRADRLPEGACPLQLGDSDQIQVGEWVVAIGNPFGYGSSMTTGIVSAVGRSIPSLEAGFNIPLAIQTDTAINPGNSGGPLLNLRGEVIGVNAHIAAQSGRANAGVGFAIPVNIVRRVVPVLIQQGAYQWPWLGITGAPVNLEIAEANNLDTQFGAYITSVLPGGPAAQAGLVGARDLTGGDVVIAVDGETVQDFADLLVDIAFSSPGDQVALTIIREGEQLEIPVTLEPRPEGAGVGIP